MKTNKKKPAVITKIELPYVICRCRDAGVHAGFLVSQSGREAQLQQGRRLWRWRVPMGQPAFLSGVAQHGLGEDCRIGCPVDTALTEVCEVLSCSPEAARSIQEYANHVRTK